MSVGGIVVSLVGSGWYSYIKLTGGGSLSPVVPVWLRRYQQLLVALLMAAALAYAAMLATNASPVQEGEAVLRQFESESFEAGNHSVVELNRVMAQECTGHFDLVAAYDTPYLASSEATAIAQTALAVPEPDIYVSFGFFWFSANEDLLEVLVLLFRDAITC
jgi:hypothetical protein